MESRGCVIGLCSLFIAIAAGPCHGAFTETTIDSDLMLCRSVPRIFGSIHTSISKSSARDLQGPEGFTGNRGRTGLPGPRGEPDYERVSTIVKKKEEYLSARLSVLERELKEISKNGVTFYRGGAGFATTTQSPEEIMNTKKCMEKYNAPISIGNMCYVVMGSEGMSLTYDFAQSNCSKSGGSLADINSRALYDKLYDYVDKTFTTVVKAWTGMTYKVDELLLSNGTQATFSKWSSYYPKKGSSYSFYRSYTQVFMYIDSSSRITALQNTRKTQRYSYAICHYDLTGPVSTVSTTTTTTEEPDYYDYYYGF